MLGEGVDFPRRREDTYLVLHDFGEKGFHDVPKGGKNPRCVDDSCACRDLGEESFSYGDDSAKSLQKREGRHTCVEGVRKARSGCERGQYVRYRRRAGLGDEQSRWRYCVM